DLVSGVTTSLATAPSPVGGTWGPAGILYTPLPNSTVMRISASGGEPTPALPTGFNLFPVLIGAGPSFLFRPFSSVDIHLGKLGSRESGVLLRNASAAALHPSGYMLFVRQGALLAQRFDMATNKMVGNEAAVADGVLTSNFGAGTALSVSASGVV